MTYKELMHGFCKKNGYKIKTAERLINDFLYMNLLTGEQIRYAKNVLIYMRDLLLEGGKK